MVTILTLKAHHFSIFVPNCSFADIKAYPRNFVLRSCNIGTQVNATDLVVSEL